MSAFVSVKLVVRSAPPMFVEIETKAEVAASPAARSTTYLTSGMLSQLNTRLLQSPTGGTRSQTLRRPRLRHNS
jgi:hypothetical protein